MQNKNNTNTDNRTGSGFLLGFILGILVTVLLTTRKGREILKELLDKSIQKLTDIEYSFEKNKQKPYEENDYVKPKPEEVKKEIKYLAQEKNTPNKNSSSSNNNGVRKLFFRKPQKKIYK